MFWALRLPSWQLWVESGHSEPRCFRWRSRSSIQRMVGGGMADVFISYKREDSLKVRMLVVALREANFDVWWDEDIPASALWEAAIEEALANAKAVVVCWSPASVDSENVRSEARVAREDGRLVQVFLKPCSPPLFFGERQGVDLCGWRGNPGDIRFSRIVDAVRAVSAGKTIERPAATNTLEMQQVRYYVALAQEQNLSRAAEKCNVTEAVLGRSIQQLERELGGPLFYHERGNTNLSELGRTMLPYLQAVDENYRAARDRARSLSVLAPATLTIGAMCTVGAQLVSDLLMRFRAQHPDIKLHVADGGGPQLMELLKAGELEVAILGVPGELPEWLHQLPIFEERFVVALSPNHRLAMQNEIKAAELDKEPYVSRSACEVFVPVRNELRKRGISPDKVFSSPRDDWVQAMIQAGMGFGFFPEFSVTSPDLVVRPLVEPRFYRTLYVATVRGRPHSPAVGAFVQQARRYPWPVSRRLATASEAIVIGMDVRNDEGQWKDYQHADQALAHD